MASKVQACSKYLDLWKFSIQNINIISLLNIIRWVSSISGETWSSWDWKHSRFLFGYRIEGVVIPVVVLVEPEIGVVVEEAAERGRRGCLRRSSGLENLFMFLFFKLFRSKVIFLLFYKIILLIFHSLRQLVAHLTTICSLQGLSKHSVNLLGNFLFFLFFPSLPFRY